jgi:hypothetical protein
MYWLSPPYGLAAHHDGGDEAPSNISSLQVLVHVFDGRPALASDLGGFCFSNKKIIITILLKDYPLNALYGLFKPPISKKLPFHLIKNPAKTSMVS